MCLPESRAWIWRLEHGCNNFKQVSSSDVLQLLTLQYVAGLMAATLMPRLVPSFSRRCMAPTFTSGIA